MWQGTLCCREAGGGEVMVAQELFPVQGVQQSAEPRHLRLAPRSHLLQGPPQGTVHAQGRREGLHGGYYEEEEEC